MLEIETGSTSSHCGENSLWKRPWTCRKTDYAMMMMMMICYADASGNTSI